MSTLHKQKVAACLLILFKAEEEKKRKRTRRVWVREWIAKRATHGLCSNLLEQLTREDATSYQNFVRMSKQNFDELLEMVTPLIRKQDTLMRTAISASDKLVITLRFLATGNSYHSLMYLFRIPVPTISKMIPEVCEALYKVFKEEYLKTPDTTAWLDIADSFEAIWNFPNCIGALDGKHVNIKAPPNAGGTYINYKKCHSIVLMALVDAKYKFIYVDVGYPGRFADGGLFNKCKLGRALAEDPASIHIPRDRPLPSGLVETPFVIVANDTFTLQRHLLKPFAGSASGSECVFNYRLARASRVAENAFGIASARFRVLRNTIEVFPQTAQKIVLCITVLHNYLMVKSKMYAAPGDLDCEVGEGDVVPGRWRSEDNFMSGNSLTPLIASHKTPDADAINVRKTFKDYFITDGELEW